MIETLKDRFEDIFVIAAGFSFVIYVVNVLVNIF